MKIKACRNIGFFLRFGGYSYG